MLTCYRPIRFAVLSMADHQIFCSVEEVVLLQPAVTKTIKWILSVLIVWGMKNKYCARFQKSFGVVKQCKNENFILRCISKMRVAPQVNPRIWLTTNPAAPATLHFIHIHKSMATILTSLHRLSNSLTSNDPDSIGYLFSLPFLLYCMSLRYLYVRRLVKHYY